MHRVVQYMDVLCLNNLQYMYCTYNPILHIENAILQDRARICKPFKEPRFRFPAWRAGTTTLFAVPARQGTSDGRIDSYSNWFLGSLNVNKYGLCAGYLNNLRGQELSRYRVGVPARQGTQAGGIDSSESILELLKSLKIRALGSYQHLLIWGRGVAGSKTLWHHGRQLVPFRYSKGLRHVYGFNSVNGMGYIHTPLTTGTPLVWVYHMYTQ
jgi:hypothetical protein